MSDDRADKRVGLYTGSFDPLTNGHLDILSRAVRLVDRLVVGVGLHPGKAPMFTAEERAATIRLVGQPLADSAGCALSVESFSGLAVDLAQRVGAGLILRGLRDGTDFDYEIQMSGMNETMAPAVQTVFLPSSPGVRPITATLVRQIAAMGGSVEPFVPREVALMLAGRYKP